MSDPLQLRVLGDDDLERLVQTLRDELLELDVDAVVPVSADAPAQSKGGPAVIAGWLAVHLGPEALRRVVGVVASWAGRNRRDVELSLGGDTLKLTGVSSQTQDEIVAAWFARHPGQTDPDQTDPDQADPDQTDPDQTDPDQTTP